MPNTSDRDQQRRAETDQGRGVSAQTQERKRAEQGDDGQRRADRRQPGPAEGVVVLEPGHQVGSRLPVSFTGASCGSAVTRAIAPRRVTASCCRAQYSGRMDREDLLPALARLIPSDRLLTRPGALAAYESDGLTSFRARPRAVVLAETRHEVIDDGAACHAARVPFMARGSGTSLSGGAVPHRGRHRHRPEPAEPHPASSIPIARVAVVEPGVVNLAVTALARTARPLLRARSVEPVGLHDRRQRRLQLRRRALLPPRHDGRTTCSA